MKTATHCGNTGRVELRAASEVREDEDTRIAPHVLLSARRTDEHLATNTTALRAAREGRSELPE